MVDIPNNLAFIAIENPLLDLTVDDNDSAIHTKYGLVHGQASLVTPEQLPIHNEVFHMAGRTTTPGGSSLNTVRAANHSLRQRNGGRTAFIGCIGNDEAGGSSGPSSGSFRCRHCAETASID